MNKNMKRDFDVVGIMLGVIIGILIGYFISSRLIEKEIEVGGTIVEEEKEGYVYLLQLAKFDNPSGALNFSDSLKKCDIYTEVVCEGNYYFIYGAISDSEEGLALTRTVIEAKGYSGLIKKEYILDKANRVLDDNVKYEFWLEGINNLIRSLKNEEIIISEKYYINPINLEFFSTISILKTIQNEEIKNKAKLQAYRMICENLS